MRIITSSIKAKLLLFIGLSFFIGMFILGATTLHQFTALQKENEQTLKVELLNKEKEGLKNATHVIAQLLQGAIEDARTQSLSEEELQKLLSAKNQEVELGEGGYFFINDTAGTTISHPSNPSLEGNSQWDMQDARGNYMIRQMTEIAQSGGGFLEYVYVNPTTGAEEIKISYVEMIEGTDYLIGAGMYESAIDAVLKNATQKVTAIKNKTIQELAIVFLACLLALGVIVYIISGQISKPLKNLMLIMERAKDGDLTVRSQEIGRENGNEIQQICVSFDHMMSGFNGMIAHIGEMTQQLAAASEELYASGEQVGEVADKVSISIENVASGAEEQSAQIEEVSKNINFLTDKLRVVGDRSITMIQSAGEVMNRIEQGNQSVDLSIEQIQQIERQTTEVAGVIKALGTRSEKVGSIVELINGIASQTNLLALNAAIEAARAGEAGRGFSVVADQIRKLAEESAHATDTIASLIKEIQDDIQRSVAEMERGKSSVENGVKLMEKTDHIFHQINDVANELKDLLQTVTTDTKEMAAYSQDVNRVFHGISQVSHDFAGISQDVASSTEEQVASTQEIISSSKQISEMAEQLAQAIERFKV